MLSPVRESCTDPQGEPQPFSVEDAGGELDLLDGDLGVGAVEGDAGGGWVSLVGAVDGGAVGGEGAKRSVFEGGEDVGRDFKQLVLRGDGGAIGAECSEHDNGLYGGSVLTE